MKKVILLTALVSFAFVGCKCNKTAETCANEEVIEVVEEGEGVVADTEVVEAAEAPAEVPAE
ncbi:hypothetical protein HDR62_04605 [bacterium]|nr:hypothetical protein [bacterium]